MHATVRVMSAIMNPGGTFVMTCDVCGAEGTGAALSVTLVSQSGVSTFQVEDGWVVVSRRATEQIGTGKSYVVMTSAPVSAYCPEHTP